MTKLDERQEDAGTVLAGILIVVGLLTLLII